MIKYLPWEIGDGGAAPEQSMWKYLYGCINAGHIGVILSVAPKQFVFIVLIILGIGFFIALLLLKHFEDRGFKINGSNSLK